MIGVLFVEVKVMEQVGTIIGFVCKRGRRKIRVAGPVKLSRHAQLRRREMGLWKIGTAFVN